MGERTREIRLLEEAARGDHVAVKVLVIESHRRLLEHLAVRIPADLRSVIDPEDVLQEAHVEMFQNLAAFEPRGPGSFYRWVATIALNRLRSMVRHHRTQRRGGDQQVFNTDGRRFDDSTVALFNTLKGPCKTPSHSVARHEAIAAVQVALAEIPEQYRHALQLVHIEGLPVREAAARMGRTDRAVHGLCRRGLARLRDRMQSASRYLSSTG